MIRQARALAPATEHFLRDAGLVSGMRVLDIGCGMGDVTMLIAQRVGPAGRIVSIDLDQASIDTARGRASAAGFENTSFDCADIARSKMPSPSTQSLDALCWTWPDPRATIDRLCGLLRPGGILALQEPSWKLWLAYTAHLPLRMAVTTFMRDAFVAGGANTEMELPLYQAFMAANLTPPQLRVELPVGHGPDFRSLLHDLLFGSVDAGSSGTGHERARQSGDARAAP